jgi:hypothetical protein
MPNIPAMLVAAHDIKAQIDELLLRGRVQDSGEHRVAATLCLTIAEQFAATLHLIEGSFSSHAPVMVRSMLEGHANLLNLVGDPAFVDQIRYDNARADVVLFTEYAADPELQGNADAQETLARWKADAEPVRDELEAKGYGKLDVYQRFKRANIEPVRFLVCRGHETITEITSYDRHNRDQEEQEPEGTEAVFRRADRRTAGPGAEQGCRVDPG